MKEVKGAEDGVLGDGAGGEQGEQEGDGQSRHRDRDGGWQGGGGGGDELVEIRGIESEEEAVGWEVEAFGGDQPQVWWQGGNQGGEAG